MTVAHTSTETRDVVEENARLRSVLQSLVTLTTTLVLTCPGDVVPAVRHREALLLLGRLAGAPLEAA